MGMNMSNEELDTQVDKYMHKVQRERKRRGWHTVAIAVVAGLLTLGVAYADIAVSNQSADLNNYKGRVSALEGALDSQRQQFNACKDKPANTPGCRTPVAPPASLIPGPKGDQGTQGLQGLPGIPGQQGDIGPRGPRGFPGPKGDIGKNGNTVTGPQGEPGASVTGPPGPIGSTGPAGPAGKDGSNGKDAPTITAFAFVGDPSNCNLKISMSDSTNYQVPVSGFFCTGP
jgi:hypothetical protein